MDQQAVFLTMVGMLVVTYGPRLAPIWFLSSRTLPALLVAWLRYVPVAVLSAMLFPALFVRSGGLDVGLGNLFLWAAVPTFLIAWRQRSLFGAVIVGMVVVAVARAVLALQG
ncbi:MAG: AzlD domain-containing protein [Thermoflexales bacterium]|nr:AzlD domain-containing protein [Thermoflexales bacterium]